jgi:hypothetical protein
MPPHLRKRFLRGSGQKPTRKTFIDNLLKVMDYNQNGPVGASIDFSKVAWIE